MSHLKYKTHIFKHTTMSQPKISTETTDSQIGFYEEHSTSNNPIMSPRRECAKRRLEEVDSMIRDDLEENNESDLREETKHEKRQKKQDVDFRIVFMNSKPFKELVGLISPVLVDCNFNIVNKSKFKGISINSIDPSKQCMIVARLNCDEIEPYSIPKDTGFCVSMSTFSAILKNAVKPNAAIEMKRNVNSTNIIIQGYNPSTNNYITNSEIPTLEKTDDSPKLNVLGYEHVVKFDLQTLRGIVKTAQNQKISADKICFQIYEGKCLDNTKETMIKVTIQGDLGLRSTHTFRSLTRWENKGEDRTIITTSEDSEELGSQPRVPLKKVFDERYSTEFLNLFMKSMERQEIVLRFSPGKPLVVQYDFGGETMGYCNFILVPIRKDVDEEEEDEGSSIGNREEEDEE